MTIYIPCNPRIYYTYGNQYDNPSDCLQTQLVFHSTVTVNKTTEMETRTTSVIVEQE